MSLRDLPAMHRFLSDPGIAGFADALGSTVVKAAVDDVLRDARAAIARDGGGAPAYDALAQRVCARLRAADRADLGSVINATGVLLHTNLGRAPLSSDALRAVAEVAGGYSNLEFDMETGTRGSRYERASGLLCALTGAEDALVVNNCAAAIMLAVDTFARGASGDAGREVVVARGELIEIGGGFRLPDVLARTGATLVEVGTTNRTYLKDFERALSPRTALLMRTHPSNVRIDGFTATVDGAELARLGKRCGVPVLEDLGSGALVDLATYGLPHERTAAEAIADGIDLVAFSGDKLLGGPQAGIVVGTRAAIARMRANPLLRALRVDKATLAALAATLRAYVVPGGEKMLPFYAMLAASREALRVRADALAGRLAARIRSGATLSIAETEATAGGGSAPGATVPSMAIAVRDESRSPNALLAIARAEAPRAIGRVDGLLALFDLRTVPPERDGDLESALARMLA